MAAVDTPVRDVENAGISRSECSRVPPLARPGASGRSKGERDSSPQNKRTEKRAKAGGRDGVNRGTSKSESERVAEAVKVGVAINTTGAKVSPRNERAETRNRPDWWDPVVKGSYRRILRLRPHDGLPGTAEGGCARTVGIA